MHVNSFSLPLWIVVIKLVALRYVCQPSCLPFGYPHMNVRVRVHEWINLPIAFLRLSLSLLLFLLLEREILPVSFPQGFICIF